MDTIALPRTIDFQMDKSLMFFGGLPPDYHERFVANARLLNRRPFNSFLGQMRAITIVSSVCKTLSTYTYAHTLFVLEQPRIEQPYQSFVHSEVQGQSLFWGRTSLREKAPERI